MKVNFKKIEVQTSFEGGKRTFDVAENLGNEMMYNGSVLLDIGFEELAKSIYYSEEGVEIPQRYRQAIVQVVQESKFYASIKRELIKLLSIKGD
nr:MAG TPA: hypothetical protein [Herelleviridae sp.]